MRIVSALLLALCLAGCNRGTQSKDAVRQGVVDYLTSKQFNTSSMDLNVTSVKFEGKRADAVVSMAPKGMGAAQAMTMQYQLEQQNGKWVVVGRKDSGGMPHSGAMPATPDASGQQGQGAMTAPAENPHGGQMPSPEALPPATNKK